MQSIEISGVRNDSINMRIFLDQVDEYLSGAKKRDIILTGAHGIILMQKDEELRGINNNAQLVTPDGMSTVLCHWFLGRFNVRKVYAPTIMINLFSGKYAKMKHYFVGGKDDKVLDDLIATIKSKYGIQNVRGFCPPFRALKESEEEFLVNDTLNFQPDFVWVGLGCPKQEKFIHRYMQRLGGKVFIGVGAGFDFISGHKPLAPTFVQNSGLEWLYRLMTDFKYLWPRYKVIVPKIIKIIIFRQFKIIP